MDSAQLSVVLYLRSVSHGRAARGDIYIYIYIYIAGARNRARARCESVYDTIFEQRTVETNKWIIYRARTRTLEIQTNGYEKLVPSTDFNNIYYFRRQFVHARGFFFSIAKSANVGYIVGLGEKANTSIFCWKSRHVDFSWKRSQFGPEFKLLLFGLRSTDTRKSSGSLWTLLICIFLCRFFNYTFIKLIFFNREKKFRPDVSTFSTKNRRVRFLDQKSTCRLFQRKIDVSAFSTKPTILYSWVIQINC